MTVQELYEFAVEHNATDAEIEIYACGGWMKINENNLIVEEEGEKNILEIA